MNLLQSAETVAVRPLSNRGMKRFVIVRFLNFFLAVGLTGGSAIAGYARAAQVDLQPPQKLDPVEGAREGKKLVADLLAEKPLANVTNEVVLKIRNADGVEKLIPARFTVLAEPGRAVSIYETIGPASGDGAMKLTIVHPEKGPDEYQLNQPLTAPAKTLSGNATMIPFGRSDFWAVDLGLGFLRWPKQTVIRKEMRKGQFCAVLESTNPEPVPGAYAQVVSWVAVNRPGVVIVHAEALDARGEVLKRFDPKKLERVNGQWQLEEMQIRNAQTGSRTTVNFNWSDASR